uniref:protein-glutamine gamma-glutamyltransferase n=1 Tax=Arion vulgaris TaxID=1028688 RepID=A0A0B7AU70_9EUPU
MSRNVAHFREGRGGEGRQPHVNTTRFQPGRGPVSSSSAIFSSSAVYMPAIVPNNPVDSRNISNDVLYHNYSSEVFSNLEGAINRNVGTVSSRPDPKKVLAVKTVDFDIASNTKDHHTNKFAIVSLSSANPQLVVRRGQPFSIEVEFTRPYDRFKDDLKLVFEAGTKPLFSKRTYVEFVLSDEDKPKEWGAKISRLRGNSITIKIFTPPTCFIAKWVFKIDVVKKENTKINVYRYVHKNPIYIIFNPWCTDDSVYMQDKDLLNEYILNETGQIYNGTRTSINSRPWNFGQFESCILDVTMYLLDITALNWAVRGNPIPIVRKLSALINSSDDGGILTGRWVEDYSDGTPPLTWTGSVPILEEYWKTKRSVNYGQCWVFAGVATTICRALGIPARSVTNFASAHDTDGSITIDFHLNLDNEMDSDNNFDSVWNFHVWTEAWMARPDLPPGYGGWQVIDATPQETSDGVFCCGPTSVVAIQQGEVNLPYDGPFVFAEVNADTVYWQPNKLGVLECLHIDKKVIGKSISTKAPNQNEREDITLTYKHNEGTPEERAAVIKANQVGSNRRELYKPTSNDVKFNLEQDSENTWLGGSFIVGLKMKNNSEQNRTVSGRMVVSTMYYTGVTAEKLKSEPFVNIVLKSGEEKVHNIAVIQDEYDGRLKEGYMLDVTVLAHVEETNQNFTKKEEYRLLKPNFAVTAPAEVVVNKEFFVEVSFANPLNSSLNNCSVTVDGVSHATKYPQKSVAPNGTFIASLPVVPEKVGSLELIIIFNSRQLEDVSTSCPINIREA